MKIKKTRSIYSQLLLLNGLTVVSVLMLIGISLYWVEQSVMRQAGENFVKKEIENIQSIYNEGDTDDNLLKKVVIDYPLRTRNSLYRYDVRIIDSRGKVVIETPGMSQRIPVPASVATAQFNQSSPAWYSYHGDRYYTLLSPLFNKPNTDKQLVQVALNTTHEHIVTHDRNIFIALLIFGILMALFLGKMATSLGLRSLNLLTDKIRNISASSLDQHINTQLLPKELANLGDNFNHMLNRIESSFLKLNQMAADLSHELRTPINNLVGQAEWLLSSQHSEDECQHVQISNLEELQRMTSLVDNILFLARAESQRPELDMKPVNLTQEITSICSYYQALADDKNITISITGEAVVNANAVMLRRLINNILSNALKYTHHHGVVTISVGCYEGRVQLLITDDGPGIALNHLPHLFDRFYRVDDARSKQIGGHGLGLAIAKTIVDLHDGVIDIESQPGNGTRVKIVLPA